MRGISRCVKFLTKPEARFYALQMLGFYNKLTDEDYLTVAWNHKMNYPLDLSNPKTFNEKMQWLKIHDRDDKYTEMVDKFLVKNYISERFGNEYVIPTIAAWDKPADIDFSLLPNSFVLKCNHNSGKGMCICKDKNQLDISMVLKELKKGINQNYYLENREWPYKNVRKKVICEKYMVDESGMELKDYKIFVFNGIPRFVEVDFDRFTDHHRNFYDTDWNYVPFTTRYPTDPLRIIEKPARLSDMLDMAKTIALDLKCPPFLRVDMYVIDRKILFGEITFYHGAGMEWFYPQDYDYELGKMINI